MSTSVYSRKVDRIQFVNKIYQNQNDRKFLTADRLKKANTAKEHCSISLAVKTLKRSKSAKIASDWRLLNEACIRRKAVMANMEEIISKISAKVIQKHG